MGDPLKDIEDRQGNIDMGKLAVQVFYGAREESETWVEAFWATVAFFTGMFRSGQEPKDEDDDNAPK